VHYQGRANAALMLLARAMDAEFVHPEAETDFAVVRGRTRECTFELKIDAESNAPDPPVVLTVARRGTQHTVRLAGRGCTVPGLDPTRLKDAVDDACHALGAGH
jgi:hypothetical protein